MIDLKNFTNSYLSIVTEESEYDKTLKSIRQHKNKNAALDFMTSEGKIDEGVDPNGPLTDMHKYFVQRADKRQAEKAKQKQALDQHLAHPPIKKIRKEDYYDQPDGTTKRTCFVVTRDHVPIFAATYEVNAEEFVRGWEQEENIGNRPGLKITECPFDDSDSFEYRFKNSK
jgi:hypothetical protein